MSPLVRSWCVAVALLMAPIAARGVEPPEPAPAVIEIDGEDNADTDGDADEDAFGSRADDPVRIATTLEEALSSGSNAYCRRQGYELTEPEQALCGLAESARGRCPEFALACARAEAPDGGQAPEGAFMEALVAALRTLGLILFWCLVAALAGLALSLLVRVFRAVGPAGEGDAPPARPLDAPAAKAAAFERDVSAHLSRARALAGNGDYGAALLELHLAVVLSLDARGLIHARRGRTNGEYARELRAEPELGAAFRDVTATAEAVHFGGRPIDASGFERVMARAEPLLVAVALVVAALAGGTACSSVRHIYRASDACGTRADGHSLLCGLLELSGEVRRRYRPLDQIEPEVSRIIVLPNSLDESSWLALGAWVENGGLAVLAASAGSLDTRFGVERNGGPCGSRVLLTSPHATAPLSVLGNGLGTPPLEPDALCSSGDVYVGHADLGAGRIVFLPTPDLLSNASLVASENARLLMPMLFVSGGRTDIVGSWTGGASQNPFASVNAAGLWPWVLQLMLLGLALARYRGAPFGRRVPPAENRRRRFGEHVQALGDRWAEAGASRAALAAYAAWAFEVLRERLPSGTDRSIAELSQVISKKTGRPDAEVARTLALARVAQSEPSGSGNEARDLDTLRRLGQLLTDIGGPR